MGNMKATEFSVGILLRGKRQEVLQSISQINIMKVFSRMEYTKAMGNSGRKIVFIKDNFGRDSSTASEDNS